MFMLTGCAGWTKETLHCLHDREPEVRCTPVAAHTPHTHPSLSPIPLTSPPHTHPPPSHPPLTLTHPSHSPTLHTHPSHSPSLTLTHHNSHPPLTLTLPHIRSHFTPSSHCFIDVCMYAHGRELPIHLLLQAIHGCFLPQHMHLVWGD